MSFALRHTFRATAISLTVAVASLGVPASATPVLEPARNDTLNLWVMDNGLGSQKAIRKIVKKFHRDGGAPVNVRVLEWGEAYAKISAALANPDSCTDFPDVLQLGSTWVPHFAANGKLRTLQAPLAQVDSSRFYTEAFKASHIPFNNNIYSFPWFLDVRTLFVNEWLWHTLDIQDSDIDSYSKFLGALRTINRGELKNSEMKRVAAFALPGHNDWTGPQQMAPFIWSFGGDFLDCKQGKCKSALFTQETLEGIVLYAKILGDEELAPFSLQENSEQNTNRFINSELLIHYGTSELVRQLEYPEDAGGLKNSPIADDGITIISLPSSSFRTTFVGGSHISLPVGGDTAKYKAAEDLAAYLLRTDNMDAFCRAVGFLPSDRGLISIWNQDRRYMQMVKALENGKSFPNIPEWSQIEGILIDFSNRMGSAFATTEDKDERNSEVAKLLLETHRKINEILGNKESENEKQLRDLAIKALKTEIQEIPPENLRFEPVAPPVPSWRVALFASLAAGIAIVVATLYLIIHFVQKRSKQRNSTR